MLNHKILREKEIGNLRKLLNEWSSGRHARRSASFVTNKCKIREILFLNALIFSIFKDIFKKF